mgnify:FL=1
MSKICNIIWVVFLLILSACQAEDDASMSNTGYLSLDVTSNSSTNTKAGSEEGVYNPKQLAVQILNEKGEVAEQTDDHTTWEGKKFSLPVGKYTVKASSNGFDGKTAGVDKPYYVGSTEVEVTAGGNVTANVICTLANVLVTVEFDKQFKESFKSATITVLDSTDQTIRFTFELGKNETAKAYFPVPEKSLIVSTSVTNQEGGSNSKNDTIREVKARDNVRLMYKVADSPNGSTGIDIQLDGTSKTYNFTIGVPLFAKTTLSASASGWSTFAYLEGKVLSKVGVLDQSKLVMEYKRKDAESESWTSVPGLQENGKDTYSAKVTGLTPKTDYQYRFVYRDANEAESEIIDFTTEEQIALYNGNFEDWYGHANGGFFNTTTWFACSQEYYTANGGSYWDSSNPGTTQDAGAVVNINPTQGNSNVVHTRGGKSAELKSQYKVKFAAASLYTGSFGGLVGMSGAKINFGQPFVSRPIALRGWFQYAPVNVTYVGENLPVDAVVEKDKPDVCAIYIAMSKKQYTVDNTKMAETAIDFENDANIIAYGEVPVSECVSTSGQWKEFNIPLKYKTLNEKPTHIIVVCSSSKYGDYFTGGNGSVLYLDDFSLIYDGEPTMWK